MLRFALQLLKKQFRNKVDFIDFNHNLIYNIYIARRNLYFYNFWRLFFGRMTTMKKIGKPVCLIVAVLIFVFAGLSFLGINTQWGDKKTIYVKGISDIRWGIDINGGLDVTFSAPEGVDATDAQMEAAKAVIQQRLVNLNITDSEVYVDNNKDRVIVRFPWKSDEENFDPEAAIKELGETAELTFREGTAKDASGLNDPKKDDKLVLSGDAVEKAEAGYDSANSQYIVMLTLNDKGKSAFAASTKEMLAKKGYISIWMDETCISAPNVEAEITDGVATISGNFTAETSKDLADKINAGALPFKLEAESFKSISPDLGNGVKVAMGIAGLIAFVVICAIMISLYRLPGIVASVCLLGQVAGTIAFISGFFSNFSIAFKCPTARSTT